MNFQEKVLETTAELRARATAFAAPRLELLKGSFEILKNAGKDLNQVARLHVGRFVKENRTIARAAGKDLGALARSTYATFTQGTAPGATSARKPRKTTATRKRTTAKAA